MAHDVFVSHASEDREVAAALVRALEARGSRCWVAWRDLPPGAGAAAIVEAIGSSQAAVLILSSAANSSPQLVREFERAAAAGIALAVLRAEPVEPSPGLAYFLAGVRWLDAVEPPLELHLAELADALALCVRRDIVAPPTEATARDAQVERIAVDVVEGDALEVSADVLALKHASGAFYGLDRAVAARYLDRLGLPFPLPGAVGEGRVVAGRRSVAADRILVVGVPDLFEFGHREIRRFASAILRTLFEQPEQTRHLAVTVQGGALLLDVGEVLESQLGGFIDALDDGLVPAGLARITFVERDPARAATLRAAVSRVLPDGAIPVRRAPEAAPAPAAAERHVAPAGPVPFEPYRGAAPYVFVSYAHADGERVFGHLGRLHAEGYRIWYDAGIEPGTNWEDSIAEAIAGAEHVLVWLSPRSAASQYVRDEVSYALNRDKPFLAAYLEETALPPGLELRIGSKQALMLFRHPDTEVPGVIAKALPATLREDGG